MGSIVFREAEIAKLAESEEGLAALQIHLNEIVEGTAFKGSHRAGLFLRHVIDQAIAGHFDSLKERAIGVELFGRSPSYVTGEDAIVRVTANDVRKRLLQHYDRYGTASEFHITLPLGSYIPEIILSRDFDAGSLGGIKAQQEPQATLAGSAAVRDSPSALVAVPELGDDASLAPGHQTARTGRRSPLLTFTNLLAVVNFALFCALLFAIVWMRSARTEAAAHAGSAQAAVLPWSALFSSPNPTHLITSDPDLVGIQMMTHSPVTVSDYANHKYIPEPNKLTPQEREICSNILLGDKASAVETQVLAEISALAQISSRRINVQSARSIQFFSLKTDDNFIFLGSPRSDPWFSLFDNQLDFRFAIDNEGLESIRNVHPRAGEQPQYLPTSKRGATGQSYGIIAFVQNPDQNGQVLLLAGTNAGATLVAGKLATDLPRLTGELQKCGIPSSGPLKHFEMLLRVNMMASSPNEFEVAACHILPGPSAP